MPDLNELYRLHQVALMRADATSDPLDRQSFSEQAERCAERIDGLRAQYPGPGPAPLAAA